MGAFFDGWKKIVGTMVIVLVTIFLVWNVIPKAWKDRITGTTTASTTPNA